MNRNVPLKPGKPLQRTSRLQSRSQLTATTGLRRSQAKKTATRGTGFPRSVRARVWARSAGRCEGCGIFLGDEGGQLQHRLARRAGGSRRNPVVSSVANGGRLCGTPMSGCHGLCEARDEHMHAAGWWLLSHQDPRDEPVMLFDASGGGVTVWLAEDGTYSLTVPEVAA